MPWNAAAPKTAATHNAPIPKNAAAFIRKTTAVTNAPRKRAPVRQPEAQFREVLSGDTLYSIAWESGRDYGELKRMYVRPEFRGRKYGELLVDHLAEHARANGITLLRLETGIHQEAAIRLYERLGFRRIPPFGPYTDDPLSRCYEKSLGLG